MNKDLEKIRERIRKSELEKEDLIEGFSEFLLAVWHERTEKPMGKKFYTALEEALFSIKIRRKVLPALEKILDEEKKRKEKSNLAV